MDEHPVAVGFVPRDDARQRRTAAQRSRKLAAALVLLAVLLFWAAALYGIKAPFYYGHYGYHGGSYATWARGTLRQHTLLPINEPGFAPPRPGTYYIHHPILTHQLVTLTFAAFGEHEWSVRLAALIPSFASLLLIIAIAWRRLAPSAGAIAGLVFALVPVNVWYSVNIDQGFPSIACLLAFFWFYLRWLETGRWSVAVAALGFGALAGGFEWSPYFAFPPIFLHVAWTGLRRRGRYLTFALLHPLVVVVPVAAHFLVVWKSGMMADLLAAYRNRAAAVGYKPFLRAMQLYGETLFGRVLLAVMFAWLLATLIRVAARRGRAVDLVGITFAFALIAYVHVFKSAVATHAYRQLYGNVWAALAVADLVVGIGAGTAWLARRLGAQTPSAGASGSGRIAAVMGGVAGGVAAAGLLLSTVPLAWAGLFESRAHGGIPGWKAFNPDLRQTAFARQVLAMTRPGDVLYFHPSFASPPPLRMDWAFYYDRDLRRGLPLRILAALTPADRRRAVAIFLPALLGPDERRVYAELTRQHPVLMVEDLAVLDLRTAVTQTRAYALAPVAAVNARSVSRWLQGPYGAPQLVRDPRREAAEELRVKLALTAPAPAPPPQRPTIASSRGKGATRTVGEAAAPAPAALAGKGRQRLGSGTGVQGIKGTLRATKSAKGGKGAMETKKPRRRRPSQTSPQSDRPAQTR